MSPVRLTALPSAWRRGLASGLAENWLRENYSYLMVVILVLLISNEFYSFGAYLPDWDWLFISGWITFLLTFKATFLLPEKVDDVLRSLATSRVLQDDENKLGDFKQGLHRSARNVAWAGGVIVAAVLVLGWVLAKRAALPSYFLTVLVEALGAFLVGSFVGRAVTYSRLGQDLKRQGFAINVNPEHLDGVAGLRPVGRLYFFQSALVAVPAIFFAVWWFLIPLFGERYSGWREVYAGFFAFVLLCEFLAFFSPLWFFHRVMDEEKQRLLIEAAQISEQVARVQKQARDSVNESDIAQLEGKLGRLTKRYRAIVGMPTWPVDKPIRRRFALKNLFLFVPVIAQVLSAPSAWQNFFENLHKIFSGQG